MRRKVLNLAAWASVLCCVTTAALWVRSVFRFDVIGHQSDQLGSVFLTSAHSAVGIQIDPRAPRGRGGYWNVRTTSGRRILLGSFLFSRGYWGIIILIPYWAVLPSCLIIPSLWLARRQRDLRRGREHLCPACGYDLRGTPDRCPECGATPNAVLSP